jgi:hypothetical protein
MLTREFEELIPCPVEIRNPAAKSPQIFFANAVEIGTVNEQIPYIDRIVRSTRIGISKPRVFFNLPRRNDVTPELHLISAVGAIDVESPVAILRL